MQTVQIFSYYYPKNLLPFYCHSCIIYKDELYLFGGVTIAPHRFRKLNLRTKECTDIYAKGIAPHYKTYGHTAILFDSKMYVFGGYIDKAFEMRNDFKFYCYDLMENHWTPIQVENEPCMRAYHSVVLYDQSMIIFGGYDRDGRRNLSDVQRFHFLTRTWEQLNCFGDLPEPVYDHRAIIFRDEMYVFGGMTLKRSNKFYKLNLITMEWKQLVNIPEPSIALASLIVDDILYVTGHDKMKKMWRLDLTLPNLEWEEMNVSTGKYCVKSYTTTFFYKDSMWIIGGESVNVIFEIKVALPKKEMGTRMLNILQRECLIDLFISFSK